MATPTHHPTRSVLPDIDVTILNGILTVTVPLTAPSNPGKQIKIESS